MVKELQLVVWGATGFTGRLVCEHIARDYQGRIRWAMAGRNQGRLDEIKKELARINPEVEKVPVIVADADDKASLAKMAAQTQVIISTAGPFASHGTNVVDAAVQEGAHYCDITGEVLWVKRMIAAHHDEAAAKGVKVVHCCGYDSIPSDIGTLFVVDHIKRQLGKKTSQVYALVKFSGGVSGGTIASGIYQVENEPGGEQRKAMGDAYYLVPPGANRGSDKPAPLRPEYNRWAKEWMAPFIMEPVNGRVVHRSAALAREPYGSDFKYRESMGCSSLLTASAACGSFAGAGAVLGVSPLRTIAKRFLPKAGSGPTKEQQLKGHWMHRLVGLTEEEGGKEPQVVLARMGDPSRDPGYWGTSRMLLEAALCLALDNDKCNAAGAVPGGVLTPATAMGMPLVERLKAAGLKFEIESSPALGVEPLKA